MKRLDWNQKEVDQLIIFVFERRVLWDRNHPQHHNQYALNEQWTSIAQEIGVDRNQARQKWKSLRDTYRKELAKENLNKALKDNILYQPTWPQYEKLHFLKEQFKYDCLSEETITEIRHTPSSNCETRTLSNLDGGSSLKSETMGIKRKDTLITEIDQNQIAAKKRCQSVKIHHDYCQRGSHTEILLDLIEEQNKSIMRYKKEVDQLKLLLDQMKNILNNLSQNPDFPSSQSLLSVLKRKTTN